MNRLKREIQMVIIDTYPEDRLPYITNNFANEIIAQTGINNKIGKTANLFKVQKRTEKDKFKSARFSLNKDFQHSKSRLENLIKVKRLASKGLVGKPFALNYIGQAKRITSQTLSLEDSLDVLIKEQFQFCKSRLNSYKRMRIVRI